MRPRPLTRALVPLSERALPITRSGGLQACRRDRRTDRPVLRVFQHAGLGYLAGPQPSGWTQGPPRWADGTAALRVRAGVARLPGGRPAITGVRVFRLDEQALRIRRFLVGHAA